MLLSLNATVPPSSEGETVAMKVTLSPKIEGLAEEVRVMAVVAAYAAVTGRLTNIPSARSSTSPKRIREEENVLSFFMVHPISLSFSRDN